MMCMCKRLYFSSQSSHEWTMVEYIHLHIWLYDCVYIYIYIYIVYYCIVLTSTRLDRDILTRGYGHPRADTSSMSAWPSVGWLLKLKGKWYKSAEPHRNIETAMQTQRRHPVHTAMRPLFSHWFTSRLDFSVGVNHVLMSNSRNK